MSFKSARDRDQVSMAMHRVGGNCGALRALNSEVYGGPKTRPATPLPARSLVQQSQTISQLLNQVKTQNIQKGVAELESWKSRHHADPVGVRAGEQLAAIYRRMIPQNRQDVTVQLVNHQSTRQNSVIVRIQGQTLSHEILVLGSHLDSINPSTNSTFAPGADDNASGTSGNLEIFRVLMANGVRPRRTIEIHAYAAEEIGLYGSLEIAKQYRMNRAHVVGMVQFDMTAYSKRPVSHLSFVSNQSDPQMLQLLGALTDKYLKVPWVKKPLTFGTSDHYAWMKAGYPAAFPTEDPDLFNDNLHTSLDTSHNLNAWNQATLLTKLGLAYALETGGI